MSTINPSNEMMGQETEAEAERREMGIDDIERMKKGSLSLTEEMRELEKMFLVDGELLKRITGRFGEELESGLQENGRNIPMNLTWVFGFPTGYETGSFLTIDLGGTNIRVCWITLTEEKGGSEMIQESFKVPDGLKTGTADQLWDYVADSLQRFLDKYDLVLHGGNDNDENLLPLGFTFSYPATQDYIDHGILQTWTKGLDIKGVEGNDAVSQLRDAMVKRKLPIRLVALINDTTGAMTASAYNDNETIIGAIFGTGCNAAYMEDCGSIPKVSGVADETPMAINCEYGAFDNSHQVLPRTRYDEIIDLESPRPGEQSFEKLSAGLYLGEIFRLVLVDLHQKGVIFKGQNTERLGKPYAIDTSNLSAIENDESDQLSNVKKMFKDMMDIELNKEELEFCQRLAELIAVRGARLCACGIAAICKKKNIKKGHVAADGSVANKHPTFKKRWGLALGEIMDWPEDRKEDPIILTSAEDGSGVGAAVIAAMTMERAKKGDWVGIRESWK